MNTGLFTAAHPSIVIHSNLYLYDCARFIHVCCMLHSPTRKGDEGRDGGAEVGERFEHDHASYVNGIKYDIW